MCGAWVTLNRTEDQELSDAEHSVFLWVTLDVTRDDSTVCGNGPSGAVPFHAFVAGFKTFDDPVCGRMGQSSVRSETAITAFVAQFCGCRILCMSAVFTTSGLGKGSPHSCTVRLCSD